MINHHYGMSTDICPVCKGSGRGLESVTGPASMVSCNTCNGRGYNPTKASDLWDTRPIKLPANFIDGVADLIFNMACTGDIRYRKTANKTIAELYKALGKEHKCPLPEEDEAMTAKEAFLKHYKELFEEECDFSDISRLTYLAFFEAGWEAREDEAT